MARKTTRKKGRRAARAPRDVSPAAPAARARDGGSESRPPAVPAARHRLLGVLLVVAGALLHPWALGAILPSDSSVAAAWIPRLGAGFGGILLLVGLGLWFGILRMPRALGRLAPVAAGALGLLALYPNAVLLGLVGGPAEDLDRAIERMLDSEELLLEATIEIRGLSRSVMNLDFPDHNSRGLFAEDARVGDLDPRAEPEPEPLVPSMGIAVRRWPIAERLRAVDRSSFRLWTPILDRVEYFDHAEFKIIDAEFTDDAETRWRSEMGFHALARTRDGRWSAVHAVQDVLWEKTRPEEEGIAAWRIREWELREFETAEAGEIAFEDDLDRAIPDERARLRARTSLHEFLTARFLLDLQKPPEERTFRFPHRYFRPPAQDRHPGIAVVDIDRDGLDDLYVMDRWGRNMLFRNRGDGTFEEIADRLGIDVKDHCSAAVFADFDNDGDDDLFLGRTLERCRYFVNEGGRFVDRSRDWVDVPLPRLASAITAADYDGDGLLDLYVSTYASDAMRTDLMEIRGESLTQALADRTESKVPASGPLADFLSPVDTQHLLVLRTDPRYGYHGYRNAYGPPNILLHNEGDGRFAEDRRSEDLRVFRHTYQATWGDYDNDGDPDLYLANDFAPNNLFRNDGDGRFADVTEETGTADIGFGMGVSWGDYDHDGRQDLYVSNMFSKAGRRITRHVPGVNPIFKAMARGNSLFRNLGDRFEKVSGTGEGDVQVEVAGWSWGSQLADFDNDTWLDLYALSGHYTAPKAVESQVDI